MRQSLIRAGLVAAALLLASSARAERSDECGTQLSAAEIRYGLPAGLLRSMAVVESGRPDPHTGKLTPWPWTIQFKGEGHFYASAAEAIRGANAQLRAGNALVDVGCLQVDLYHHPKAFPTLAAAFDPARNVDYAAHYLRSLAEARGSWLQAVAAYNAGEPADGLVYLAKVLHQWKGVSLAAHASVDMRPARLTPTPLP